ncbi:FapA family protein [Shewanella sp. GXUN23E]|uniref:DUF342 domain-containing protein n=1 Tax=Shewanella sp. GXUN23E TaxID=3422498 RepID=UPI003D7CCFA1
MNSPELISLSADKRQLILTGAPMEHFGLATADIMQAIKDAGFGHYCPLSQHLEYVTQELSRRHAAGDHSHLSHPIAERRDAILKLDISTDLMQVQLHITSPWGGRKASLLDVLKQLKTHQIRNGILKGNIEQLLKQSALAAPGSVFQGMIARGRLPHHGRDAKNIRKVPLARERMMQPKERDNGTVDLRDLGKLASVSSGDILMVKRPPSAGFSGYNVRGEVLPALPGKDIDLIPGPGTRLDNTDPAVLLADRAGLPQETPHGMLVDEVLLLHDVDPAHGHVEFKGSVLIRGDIKEGMKVRARGDICVQGLVQSAQLESGGDIVINQGVLGRQHHETHSLAASLVARGQICAPFVQYANLNAGGDINITRQLLHSQVVSQGDIMVCDRFGKRGDIVGGSIRASAIKVVALGADASTRTRVECDDHRADLKQQIKELEVQKQTLVVRKIRLENQLQQKTTASQDNERFRQMNKDLLFTATELNQLSKQLDELLHHLEHYYEIHNVQVRRCLFPNVEIVLGKASHKTNRIHGNCTVKVQHKEVIFDYQSKPNFVAPR